MSPSVTLYAFINGNNMGGGVNASVLSDSGDMLLEHALEKAEDGPHFTGCGASDIHHDIYREYAPDGFVVRWVENPLEDADVQAAYALHLAKAESAAIA